MCPHLSYTKCQDHQEPQELSCSGDSVFVNYVETVMSPQLIATFAEVANARSDIQCIGSTVVIQSGNEFIRDYFDIASDAD